MLWDLVTGSSLTGFAMDILMLIVIFMLAWRYLVLRPWSNIARASSILLLVDRNKNVKLKPVKGVKGGTMLTVKDHGAFFVHPESVYVLGVGNQVKTLTIAYTPIGTTIPIEYAEERVKMGDGSEAPSTIPLHKKLEEVIMESFTPSALFSALKHAEAAARAMYEEEAATWMKYIIIGIIVIAVLVIGGALLIKAI